ncbi:MAG TPA: phosphatidate cytidylyltransferase [Solirubrobacteraceae bacterium]|nr:phosphatidate cytidylyltransferase [Solirubrobacteraceae bacterium]
MAERFARGASRPDARDPRDGGRRRERRERSELTRRIVVAIPAIIVAVVIVDRGGLIFTLAMIVVGWACLDELYRMFGYTDPLRLAGLLALVGLLLAARFGSQYEILLVAVATLPACFLLAVVAPRGSTIGIAVTLLGIWWIGFALAHAVLLRDLPHGEGVIIDILVGTFAGDTGAYLGGRMFGRRKLAPRISPNKTVEGLAIGCAVAIGSVWFASLYQDWMHKGDAVLLGIGVAIAAPVGDLFESYVKREAGTKDSGRLFGPHGGALDRLDAAMFAAVVGFYIWHAML